MPHKADRTFFERKRTWSSRKDSILGYCLTPYLANVAQLRRPILLVDGFAGPGKFDDGTPGSPLIICEKAKEALDRGASVSVLCIESDEHLHGRLAKNLSAFSFARPLLGKFANQLAAIADFARSSTVFLYVDPWTVEGLDWYALDEVFEQVHRCGASVELLLNFNAPGFARRGLAALQREVPALDPTIEDTEEMDMRPSTSPSLNPLNTAVGGGWWQDLLRRYGEVSVLVEDVTARLAMQLRDRFKEVCYLPIRAKPEHRIPKYYLIFSSRHPDALELMNDAAVQTSGDWPTPNALFALHRLRELLLEASEKPICRRDLVRRVIREAFSTFSVSEIRKTIGDLLEDGQLASETGKSRINDSVQVWSK